MITLSSIAFMFSCFKIKPAAATIITLTILFVDMILQGFPFFKPYESYFVTWRMSAWVFLMEQHDFVAEDHRVLRVPRRAERHPVHHRLALLPDAGFQDVSNRGSVSGFSPGLAGYFSNRSGSFVIRNKAVDGS